MAKEAAPLESVITAKIKKAVNALPGCRLKKFHGTQFGECELDLYGLITRPGENLPRPAFLEIKRPGKEPSPRQAKEIRNWKELGAITGYATSVEEAFSVLGLNT